MRFRIHAGYIGCMALFLAACTTPTVRNSETIKDLSPAMLTALLHQNAVQQKKEAKLLSPSQCEAEKKPLAQPAKLPVVAPDAPKTSKVASLKDASQQGREKSSPEDKTKEIPNIKEIANEFYRVGSQIVRQAERYRWRQQRLVRLCKNGSTKPMCQIFWRSARIFAANYQTSPSKYRGYLYFHKKNKKKIPSHLLRWYYGLSSSRYSRNGRCYLSQGLFSNCLSYARCSQKMAYRYYKGKMGKDYRFSLASYSGHLAVETYERFLEDTKEKGRYHLGIKSLLRDFDKLSLREKKTRSEVLLNRMLDDYLVQARRQRGVRKERSKNLYEKAFCANIVASSGDFSRALPGDFFAITYPYKRSKRRKTPSAYMIQHWGMIKDPKSGKVIHNQTPGGVWGTQYHRWGLQYDDYKPDFVQRRDWKRKGRGWAQRVVVASRLNLHYLHYAKQRGLDAFDEKHPTLCREWIRDHGAVYFANLAAHADPASLIEPPKPTLLAKGALEAAKQKRCSTQRCKKKERRAKKYKKTCKSQTCKAKAAKKAAKKKKKKVSKNTQKS